MMQKILLDDWKDVLRHSWSIKLMALAGLLSALEAVLPFLETLFDSFNWPKGVFAGLSAITVGAAFVARLLAQSALSRKESTNADQG